MADPLSRVGVTATFLARLETIATFLDGAGAPESFDGLLADLQAVVVPNLARFPGMGRRFVDLAPRSVEALAALRLLPMAGGELREYLHGDYLILYDRAAAIVHLLTIRHHRELAYDFGRIWPSP